MRSAIRSERGTRRQKSRIAGRRCPLAPSTLLFIAGTLIAAPAGVRGDQSTISAALDRPAHSARIEHAARALTVSLKCPRFDFGDSAPVGGTVPSVLKGDIAGGQPAEADFLPLPLDGVGHLDVKLFLQWSPRESVLRKWARFRLSPDGSARVLNEIILEDLDTSLRPVELLPRSVQSCPAFFRGFFAGIEFPIATTRIQDGHLLLAHRPCLRMRPAIWYETRRAVYGVAPHGDEKRAFQRYIERHRPGPAGLHVNYNSWWTSPVPYTEQDILGLIDTFRQQLYQPHRATFDTFCIDMGWSNSRSIWEIDPKLFPQGFTKLRDALDKMKCHLGLWISPSSCYPFALDNAWAMEQGYETFSVPWGESPARFACLAGPRYRTRFQQRLVEMVRQYGIRHIKLDGYLFECPATDHGHEAGALSSEPIADGIIAVAQAVRRAAPDIWLEPTCFGWNPSPWWLFHFNSVIGTYGDDAPWGRVPAPVYRDSYTTARDYFNLQGAFWNPVPIAAQEVLGIVHQTREPFLNDSVMTVMRGHMFLPVYLNPAHMSGPRWRDFAALLTWARKNASRLRHTEPLLPASWLNGKCPQFTPDAPMPREPYGYAHWKDGRALIALRNPWIAPQTFALELPRTPAAPARHASLSVISLYPEPRVYGRSVRPGDTLDVPLAPYETVVLAVAPEQQTRGLPDVARASRDWITARVSRRDVSKVAYEGPSVSFGPDWTSLVGNAVQGVRVELEAEVAVTSPHADLLVLLEDDSPPEALCRIEIDGRQAPITSTGSEGGWGASGHPKPEHWLFFRAALGHGDHDVRLELLTGDASPVISVWVWAAKSGVASANASPGFLPPPETISLDAAALLPPEDTSALPVATTRTPRPTERIDGVFLDTLDPVSVSQGWGALQRNRSVWDKPMTIAGTRYLRGLGTHAASRIVFALDRRYRRFQSWVGADSATAPTITFEVWIDGEKRWESGLMQREDPAERVDLDISTAKTLELVVTDGGNGVNADHANWADARLVR